MARSNARLEVSGAGKTEDGLVQYNEEVNKLGDDLRELYETIRVNVDEEEQWKVFDFVEDFFMEELEIGDYINDINSYHLHMFDKHDVTTKKFDAIVEKAGKVDANYAAQIEGYCSLLGEYGKKFETVCAMLALDLIGVKVFRYSDETAEAVASGEKLLKESGTIYESFADMMSPDDAAKYLDFLENGSREGLTSAELAGVEKADVLLVSRKVEYEDVWDLRNVGDLLESGSKGGSGSFGIYSTKIDNKVRVIDKQELPSWLGKTFKDGNYRTVVTNEEIIVYRSFGHNAEAGGAFATSSPALNRVQTKIDSAILPEWKNTLRYEAEIVIPKGTTLNIGRVEEQFTMSGARLAGDADQFLLPENWDLNWIKSIREVKP